MFGASISSSDGRNWLSRVPAVALILVLVWLLWPAFSHAFDVWLTTEEFSFGFLVVPVAVAVAWWRRGQFRRSISSGTAASLPVILGALAIYLLAERLRIHALAGLAVSPLLFGLAAFRWGWVASRVLAFPIGFLAFGLGLFRGLLDTVGFALQGITAVGATGLAQVVGVPVVRDGLILESNKFAFIVAEPCSGMSSLVSLLALAALWTSVNRGSVGARAAVVLSVLPLVIVANSTRVALVLVVANLLGQETALGFFHGASSFVLFSVALAGLALVSRTVGCEWTKNATFS